MIYHLPPANNTEIAVFQRLSGGGGTAKEVGEVPAIFKDDVLEVSCRDSSDASLVLTYML